MKTTLPPSGIGSLLTLESAVVVALMKIIEPRAIFEFGTFTGYTTLLLAANSHCTTKVTTLDLPSSEIALTDASLLDFNDAHQNDQFLKQVALAGGAGYLDRAPMEIQQRVERIHCNSHAFGPASRGLIGTQDFILVDGGHDYATIKNDSEKAFEMCQSDSVVIWHDYQSKIHTEVTVYLEELSRTRNLISIGSTMLVICLNGRHSTLIG